MRGLPDWEHFEHVADIGVRGFGKTPEEAFEKAALALTAVVTDPESVMPTDEVTIELDIENENDLEGLLVDFLNAVIYEMAVRRMVFSRFEVHIDGRKLKAILMGEPVKREKHQPAVEVKGATYTELKVGRTEEGRWFAQCVLDV